MERKPYLIDELAKGDTFRSKHFEGLVTVIDKREKDNVLVVEIDPELDWRQKWQEDWNLEHTAWGFDRGDYYKRTPAAFGDIDETVLPLSS
jgi:hypothetical protein